jgi:hypothetical protein
MIAQPSGMIAGTKAISPYKGACWNLNFKLVEFDEFRMTAGCNT